MTKARSMDTGVLQSIPATALQHRACGCDVNWHVAGPLGGWGNGGEALGAIPNTQDCYIEISRRATIYFTPNQKLRPGPKRFA